MKAAVLTEPGHFEVQECPVPQPQADEVLIKVYRCGICGTDMHIFHGHYSVDKLPLIPGHEFSGTIAALGSAVRHLKTGQAVTVDINHGCGHCYYCRKNEVLNCQEMEQIGITKAGGFAEYVCVPAHLIVPAPAALSLENLSLVEPVSCVVRSARKFGMGVGESVVIIGGGPVGNLHTQMMRLIGAAPIIVLEISPDRAEKCIAAGADVVVSNPDEMAAVVRSHTDGRGADHVIESVGREATYQLATQLMRPGGQLCAFGLTGAEETLCLNLLETVLQENAVKGSVAGMGEDMFDAVHLIANGRFDLSEFKQLTYPLDAIQTAFESFNKNPAILKSAIQIAV